MRVRSDLFLKPSLSLTAEKSCTLLYTFFWVIPRRLYFIFRRFGTLYLFHLHRQVGAYKNGTECSETSAYKIQTPVNYPEGSIEHSEHGESLK
jgi:hypothetical protein